MKKNTPDQPEKKPASYYDLHTEAVEELVSADKENTPRYSREELEKYRSGKVKWRMPEWLKVILIKFWFYGAVCFFVFMGLGMYVGNQLDMLFIAAIVLGMVTDLLINHFLRFTEKLPGGSARWIMVTRRGAVGFLMNLMYGFLLMFLVVTVYNTINSGIYAITGGDANSRLLSVEPVLFGLFTTGVDTLCVAIRNTFLRILADAKRK
ncbi:MAG: hypothetical protein E7316_03380 [Clostridiales bacterium]|nr:hypothetical protein [Clostridiales bacterium]